MFDVIKDTGSLVAAMIEEERKAEAHRFHNQKIDERRRRINFVIKLSAELNKVLESGYIFASAYAEDAIAGVFNGDWRRCKDAADILDPDNSTVFKMEARRGLLDPYREFVAVLRTVEPGGDA